MKSFLKKLIAGMVCFTLVLGLIGCGGEKTDKTNSEGSKEDVTITYAIWDKNQEPGMRAIADRFEELNPGIKVKVEVTPWTEYWQKLEAAATGAALPDTFWMHTAHFIKYAKNDMLMSVGEKVEADSELDYSKYPEGLVRLYEYEGKNYAIPKDYDTIGLWYNKTMFDEAGIPYPDDSWDWDKFIEVAKQLTDESKGVYGFAAPLDEQQGYGNTVYQNGGYLISEDRKSSGFDKQETIDAMQWYIDLIYEEKVSPSFEQLAETNFIQMFESGKVAMVFMGSWMVTQMKNNEYTNQNCDVAVLPKGTQRASIYNGLGNVISKKTKYPEEAWKFVRFLGTEEANMIQSEYGSAIPAYEGTQEPWIEYSPDFNLRCYVDMLSYGIPYPTSKTRPVWQEVVNDGLRKVFNREVSVEEGCKEIADKMNEILKDE